MEKLQINGIKIPYTIIKKNKKYLSITVKRTGEVIVSVPNRTSEKYIKQFLYQKSSWIYKKYLFIQENKKEKKFIQNEEFLYLGRNYKLNIIDSKIKRSSISLEEAFINVSVPETKLFERELIKKLIIKWYKKSAETFFVERYNYFSQVTGLEAEIRVRNLKRSHGICYSNKKISLNWKLIMCEDKIIDYVILHEMCHLVHMNHSKEFWAMVERYMPEYKLYSAKLKQLSRNLIMEI